jgi:hypothetical protein
MTHQIYDTKQFPFSNIHLGKPYNLNGMYFIKMFVKDSPIYVQPPKCFIKQGILKSGKKWFCDLVFSIEDGYFLTWLEQIEEIAKQKIFENRANWFETELDEHDIENSLVSPYKMFRSGKFFIIRANLPTTLDKCDLKIYDESETEIQPEDVKEETNVITILELKGIKCSARNFQFVLDVRQMLVVSPVKIFEKCIIKKIIADQVQVQDGIKETSSLNEKHSTFTTDSVGGLAPSKANGDGISFTSNGESVFARTPTSTSPAFFTKQSTHNEQENPSITMPINENPSSHSHAVETSSAKQDAVIPESTTMQSVNSRKIAEEGSSSRVNTEMYEFEIDLADLEKNDAFQIKPRNDVYYKLYKEAKQKAKEAKLLALSNYLEAKRLKTTYLLEDSSDSSDDEEGEDTDDMDAV